MTDLKWVIPLLNVKRENTYNTSSKYCICGNLLWPPEPTFYAMQNESLISFGPKYFLKMMKYTVSETKNLLGVMPPDPPTNVLPISL